ncbi:transposable element gene, partial [Prunus dulcis]
PSVSISSPSPYSSSPPVPVNVPIVTPPPPPAHPSPVHTRSKFEIVKPNPKYHANFSTRYPVPHAFSALGTWTLVPSSPLLNTVGCKCVFRIKRCSDGTIERYKARLVAKGFHQQSGIDYFDTFSHVVMPTIIRTMLCLAISFGWPLRQLDVKNAFLHGSLSEDVYMWQPPGFADLHRPNHVCKLNKAIYGLNNSSHLIAFLRTLGTEFDIKDLGHLNYFLGVEVHYHPTSIHLTQNKYTIDLLKRSNLLDCKPVSTPMTSKGTLSRTHGTLLADPTPYRQMVGALQYLSITRLDISYAVQHVSQFMGSPGDVHFEAVKQILSYLKGTLGVGLPVRRSPNCSFLVAYSDADWASCPDTRRSTIGYCVFLGPNLISWSAKKRPTVSRSSAEAEYRARAYACADTLWIQGLLAELRCPLTRLVLLHCDNLFATYLAANPFFHARTKHIDIDYHFVRERVASGSHKVQFIPSHLQLADVFTKGLPTDRFARLVSKLVTYL